MLSSTFKSDHQSPSSNLFNFPSPFLDEHESPLNQIFFQTLDHHSSHQLHTSMTNPTDATKRASKEGLRRRGLGVVPRRRTGKKDRHSKICTAQGVRDRRMRLSLQVARKFFDLQDMLGYDKASKTIEWLFTKSKKAIKDLINDHHQNQPNIDDVKSAESFLSESCEVVSASIEENNKDTVVLMGSKSSTREKARERARSRTRDKMMEKQKLGFSNTTPFEGPYESDLQNTSSFQHQLADVGTIEKFLQGNSSSSSSAAADFMGFFGNWDLLNGERSSSIFSVTNQVSFPGNPNDEFP